ncbi:protein translocase subunit SecF [Tamaricihabitans halophyticus]|uniref:protein translocase subunit SecF n=1 Tax=Tamaricihabitans halophyticus TaxID=1262583 RepID=UPI001FB2A04C|nr:protein translocase subunit SecF [Tamaricihabitans halophyticus]
MTPTKKDSLFHRLYVGTGAFDIVGKRKRWYVFFSVLMLVCIGTALFKGFNFGLEFTGGTQISMPTQSAQGELSEERVREVFNEASPVDAAQVQTVGTGGSASVQIRSDHLTPEQTNQVQATLFQELQPLGNNGQPSQQAISDSAVSGTWGGEISRQALIALAVFFVLVSVFLALYFEKWMAVAAMITVVHDVVLTAGVYAIVGLEVTPASVIGLLTILGYSLYDTVVVFDKVKENTRGILGLTRRTYAEAANLAVNQTLARSINTTVIALLPVVALLAIGVGLLGVGTLQDLAVVQAVGVFAGTVSSVLLATPLLVDFKMRGQDYKDQARKVQERRDRVARKASGEPAATAEDMDWSDEESHDKELRKEKAAAAAASVPTRAQSSRSSRSTSGGQKATKPSASGRPTGKASRPTGKKRR